MSNRAISAVLDYSHTKGSERVLMFVIADGLPKDGEPYRAKIETLKRQCGDIDPRYIHRLINRLVARGELIIFDRYNAPNSFAIPLLAGEVGYAPETCDAKDHICNGLHTPLHISREDATAEEIKAQRQRRRAPRTGLLTTPAKPRTGLLTTPAAENTSQDGLLTTPGWSMSHPRMVY